MIEQLQQRLLLRYLMWRSRPERITRYLGRQKYLCPPKPTGEQVRAAAIQGELTLVSEPLQYAEMMYKQARQAVQEGAQLVVFPEDNAAHLLGMLPGVGAAGGAEQALSSMGEGVGVADIFAFLTPVTKTVYQAVFSRLAKGFRVHIMAGTIVAAAEDGRVYNEAYLFAPDGSIVGSQRKLHLLPLEAEWGLSCGERLEVFDTPAGRLACPVCMDATYFETFRIAAANGAETVLIPAANPDEYNFWKELRGVWPRVQESGVFGIRAGMVGEVLGMKLTGRSGIFAPVELSPDGDGVLAMAKSFDRPEVVTAVLDYRQLRSYRNEHFFVNNLNMQVINKYLPCLYR